QLRVRGRMVPTTNRSNVVLELPSSKPFESDEVSSTREVLRGPGAGLLPITTNRFRLSEEVEVRYVCGDGTVPIGSLGRGFGSDLDYNATNAKVYALIGADDEITGHNPM